jgi:type I restriction enzyme S subunit
LPSPQEQTTIATFLDRETAKIDALIAEQERLIALLAEKRQAVISHAVTKGLDPTVPMKDSGVEWLGAVPEHWETGALKHFWSVTDCKHVTAEFVDEGIPLASIREVQSVYVDLSNAKKTTEEFYVLLTEGGRKPIPGDIIYGRNASVGEAAMVSEAHEKFAMGQDVCLLRSTDFHDTRFMHYQLRSLVVIEQLEVLMVGATFRRINVDNIRTFIVGIPPFEEQISIADYLDKESANFHALMNEARRAIDLLKERRSALISAAVTGKIDVRGLAGKEAA